MEEIDLTGAEEMKKLFVCLTVVLLFSAGAALAGGGGDYGAPPYGPEPGSDPRAQGGRPDPGSQKEGGPNSGGEYGAENGPHRGDEAGSLSRQKGPNNPVGSRWQIEGGGFIEMGGGRSIKAP